MTQFKYCLFFLLLLSQAAFANQTSVLEKIPPEDRQFFLKNFRIILLSEFGFTLIDEKPFSLEEFSGYKFPSMTKEEKCKLITYTQLIFENSENFEFFSCGKEHEYPMAYLINRRLFRKLNIDPDDDISFDAENLGKLFGFGEENTHFYLRRFDVGGYLKKPPFVILGPRPLRNWYSLFHINYISKYYVQAPYKEIPPEPNENFTSLEEEWEWLEQNQVPIEEWDIPPKWIRKPVFICKKGQETDDLAKKYDLAANKLGKLMHDNNWFELVLKRI